MGERKGQNLWYPPDYDPTKGGLNKWQGTHALRERARKLHLGILIIRFEMPYNIWCEGCGNHVGMGVRYNAEKKKVGMYYTTPVYQFRMKCHLCDNHFEIKTDPANLDYEIVSGARRQERRWDSTQNGQVVPEDKEVAKKLFDAAMFKLEHGEKDVSKAKDAAPRIKKLTAIQDRVKDDYLANRILRDDMRAKRKAAKGKAAVDNALLKRASLEGSRLKLVPETEEDAKTAALLSRLQPTSNAELERRQREKRDAVYDEDIFKPSTSIAATTSKGRLESIVKRHRDDGKASKADAKLKNIGVVLNKKRKVEDDSEATPSTSTSEATPSTSTSLVCDYGSTSSDDSGE